MRHHRVITPHADTIVGQLRADEEARELIREADKRRNPWPSELMQADYSLRQLLIDERWGRDDLIALVDHAVAEHAAMLAEDARELAEEEAH